MVIVRRRFHPGGLSLHAKDKIYVKRKRDKKTRKAIANEVWNNAGERPYWKVVWKGYWEFFDQQRMKKDRYSIFGRKKGWATKAQPQHQRLAEARPLRRSPQPRRLAEARPRRRSPQHQRLAEAGRKDPVHGAKDWQRQGQQTQTPAPQIERGSPQQQRSREAGPQMFRLCSPKSGRGRVRRWAADFSIAFTCVLWRMCGKRPERPLGN